jgi:signal peptidase II
MIKLNFRKILLNFIIILAIFFLDRVSKNYILNIAAINSTVDIYVNSYLNLYLIWNKGIAFGLFSFNNISSYNLISVIIALISLGILVLIVKNNGIKKYALLFILGGALGNFFDRIYYAAVPDFIDLHIKEFHWFVFNVADIFITTGVICLIFVELFYNKKAND